MMQHIGRKPEPKKESASLKSIRIIGRMLYINNDPGMNHMLPLSNAWTINDLAGEIMRACTEYDIAANWQSARYLARIVAKEIVRDIVKGGFSLDWD